MSELLGLVHSSMERAPWGWALLATALVTLIKVWPVLSLQATKAREKIREEGRTDLHDCQAQVTAMGVRVSAVEQKANRLERRLMGALTAYRILDVEVAAFYPDSVALAQARAVLSQSFDVLDDVPPDMEEKLRDVA